MKKLISLHVLIVSFTFIFFSIVSVSEVHGETSVSVSPIGHEITGNQWLFLIGINTYNEWPHLSTAVNDAGALKDVLVKRYYFDEYHVIELYDKEATRKNILAKLRYLSRRVGPEDSVVIFYSGHGIVDSEQQEGSWVPVDGSFKDRSSWISNQEFSNYLKIDAIKARHVLLIADSCFTGNFYKAYKGRLPKVTDKVIEQVYKNASRQIITSGGLKPLVIDQFNDKSVFTHFLVKVLNDNNDPFLTPSELVKVLKAGFEKVNDLILMFGTLRDKREQGERGELVFFLDQDELERIKELKRYVKDAEIVLRSAYRLLSVPEIQSMPYVDIREEMEWGYYGHSTIHHKYEAKTIGYDRVVIDHATGLMWHQNGSENFMKKDKITAWIDNLNLQGYAGYKDWRLPTAEEAASLLEPEQKYGGLYVDAVFGNKQTWLWTGDSYKSDAVWVISTCYGSVFWSKYSTYYSIRPVRSIK